METNNNTKKILIISHDGDIGGAINSLKLFIKYSIHQNDFYFFMPNAGKFYEYLNENHQGKVLPIIPKKLNLSYRKNYILYLILSLFYRFIYPYRFVKQIINTNKYDLVYFNTIRNVNEIILFKIFSKSKLVVHIRGLEVDKFISKFRIFIIQILANRVITLSNEDLNYLRKLRFSKDSKKIIVIPNGIEINDNKAYLPNIERERNIIKIVSFGTIMKNKGVDLFSEIANRIYNIYKDKVKFYWYGELRNAEKSFYEELNSKYKDIIDKEILNFGGYSNKPLEILEKSHILLFTSRFEGIPRTILEGMLSKAFIITSNVGGIPDLIDNNKNGILIDYRQSDDKIINDAIVGIKFYIDSPELANNYCENAYKKLRTNFDIKTIVAKIDNVLEEQLQQ